MSVALRKIEGVDTVAVSLNDGVADITLRPGNTVDPERIREVVRDNGFTPKTADVRVTGRITKAGGKWSLTVIGLGIVYELVEHPDAPGALAQLDDTSVGAEVSLSGRLPEADTARAPDAARTLQLFEFTPMGR